MSHTTDHHFDLGSHTLSITYTRKESIANARLHNHVIDKTSIIGFDTESKPQFIKGRDRHKVATIQIATLSGHCLVYHIIKDLRATHETLERILGDPRIKKVGAGIHGDISFLHHDYSFVLNSALDISLVVKAYIEMVKDMHHRSLSLLLGLDDGAQIDQETIIEYSNKLGILYFEKIGIAGIAQGLKIPFNKSKKISTSNWEGVPLSQSQLHYAAADSWIVVKAHESLVKQFDDDLFPKDHVSRIMNLLS